MPRRRSGPAPRPAARPAPQHTQSHSHSTQAHSRPQTPPPPAPAPSYPQHAPPPAHPPSGGGGMLSGLGGMVAQGMALGTGSALAHRAVDAVFSSGSKPEPQAAVGAAETIVKEHQPCSQQAKYFADCMANTNGDMGACQNYFDAMQSCRMSLYQ